MSLEATILNLWQVSRIALAALPHVPTRYERMQYVKKELQANNKDLITHLTPKHLWFKIEDSIS